MTTFRINPEQPFRGPHQHTKVWEAGAPLSRARAAMILVHGRGATAQDVLQLADVFAQPDVHYVAPQAANYAWYPYSFLEPQEKNEPGLSSGLQRIYDLLEMLREGGLQPEKIFLLGFSQGGCLATEFAARHPQKFGGVIGLSGGLIGSSIKPEHYSGSMEGTPVFLGCSDRDPHIPRSRVDETAGVFEHLGAKVDKRIYANMGHTVNDDEVKAVRGLLASSI